MGILDGPSWGDRMLWAQKDTAEAAQSTARSAKSAARAAAATAYYGRAQARSSQAAAESSIRQEGQLGAMLNEQRLTRLEATRQHEASQRLHADLLDAQRKTGWMQYRNTPDGEQFMVWARAAASVLDRIDALNQVWLDEFQTVVRRTVSEWEWVAEKQGDYLPPNHTSKSQLRKVLPATLKFAGKQGAASFASRTLLSNPKWAEENAAIRAHWHRVRLDYFGCDPVVTPGVLPPGWAVGEQNWLLPMQIREFFEYAYTNYPGVDAFPRDLVRPVLKHPSEVLPGELAPLLAAWHRG